MAKQVRRAKGLFLELHDELIGVDIDFSTFDPSIHAPEHIAMAQLVWADRVRTEFRSVQIMTRFLSEVMAANDPLEVYAGAGDLIMDELRHVSLCVRVVDALGGTAHYPEPPVVAQTDEFLGLPMAQRALSTALSMLAVSETLSTGFIQDLYDRCEEPAIHAVLHATIADEDTHHEFGWQYVERSLARFTGGLDYFRLVVRNTLHPHLAMVESVLHEIPMHKRHLDAWKEPDLAALGLHSKERQALVLQHTYQHELAPRLEKLELL